MPGDYLLALDIGTTAIKVGLFRSDGTLAGMATREQQLAFPAPGRVEQSPQGAIDLLAQGVGELLAGADPSAIAGIALTNHRGTAIALDADGSPLSDFVVWMDKRGVPYVDWLNERLGLERYYDTAGHPIVSYTGVSKVLWFQRSASALWEKAAVVGPPQTFFLKWLGCDDLVCDVSSGTFLFPFDIDAQTWSSELAAQIGYPLEKLPRLVHATDVVGELSATAAATLGLCPGIPLIAGGGDGQCAGVGSGVIQAGRAMINIGTGAGVQVFMEEPRRDPTHTLNIAAHVVRGFWEMEGHTQSSGAAFRWLRDTFGAAELALERSSTLDAYDLLIAQAHTAPPGAEGLIFIPTFNGSSAPIVDLHARSCLLGLSLNHTRGHVIRALLEGISMELRWMLDAIKEAGAEVNAIYLAGGGASNSIWNQIHTNVFDQPVRTLRIRNAAMTGAAMCAAIGLGFYQDWQSAADAFIEIDAVLEPQAEHRVIYEQLYANYKDFFRLLSDSSLMRRLSHQTIG